MWMLVAVTCRYQLLVICNWRSLASVGLRLCQVSGILAISLQTTRLRLITEVESQRVAMLPNAYRSSWVRRVHATLGLISALNLLLLICTGLLLQHATLLRLEERSISRRLLPASYRPQDGDTGVRADIVITDLHSGRILGTAGRLFLDVVTLTWLVMLITGLVMYSRKRSRNGASMRYSNGSEDGES